MRLKIVYLGLVRSRVGKKEEEYEIEDGSTLLDLLKSLAQTYGKSLKDLLNADEQNRLDPTCIVTVNGILKDSSHGSKVTLGEGDTVALMTLISGG